MSRRSLTDNPRLEFYVKIPLGDGTPGLSPALDPIYFSITNTLLTKLTEKDQSIDEELVQFANILFLGLEDNSKGQCLSGETALDLKIMITKYFRIENIRVFPIAQQPDIMDSFPTSAHWAAFNIVNAQNNSLLCVLASRHPFVRLKFLDNPGDLKRPTSLAAPTAEPEIKRKLETNGREENEPKLRKAPSRRIEDSYPETIGDFRNSYTKEQDLGMDEEGWD